MAKPRVAVVGASGFVGSTLVEHLVKHGWDVKPIIHGAGNAWRIARLGVPIRMADIMSPTEAEDALRGSDVVVNCSRGDPGVMLKGLANLLSSCRSTGVERFIHLSSVAVYGDPPGAESVTESATPAPVAKSYGHIKLRQDQMVAKAADGGLSSISLCPPNIGGPYSAFHCHLVRSLQDNRIALLDDGSAAFCHVDVGNLAHAITLAFEAGPKDGGRVFITDDDPVCWRDVIDALDPLRKSPEPVPCVTSKEFAELCAASAAPSHSIRDTAKHLVSSQVREVMRQDPLLAKLDALLRRGVAALGQSVEDRVRESIEAHAAGPASTSDLDLGLCRQQLRKVNHSCELAKRCLGYEPVYSFSESMAAFRHWYRAMSGLCDRHTDLLAHIR